MASVEALEKREGLTLAYELGKAGIDVLLLLEKGTLPNDTLSTHNFFSNSVAMLRDMGVMDRLLATETPLYKRAYIVFDDAVIDGHYPEVNGENACFCIKRTYLDHALFEAATAQAGVTAIDFQLCHAAGGQPHFNYMNIR
ncbi:FAD-dependent oxidoreductase [Paenibacillus aurantiacus]|uniref:FAD-dependent oxidoreductase n=1 Tax=Paenibacillus aurantiacus TaxID=1936118 RepID=A0ABV5KTY5_9BACL